MRRCRLLTFVSDFNLWAFDHHQSAFRLLATRQARRPGPLYVRLLRQLDPYHMLTPYSMARDNRAWSHSPKPCTGTTNPNSSHTRRVRDHHQQPRLPRRRVCGKQLTRRQIDKPNTGALYCTDGPCVDDSFCGPQVICGYGPGFYDAGCTSNCDATAMCGEYSEDANMPCGMKLCCSATRWCGSKSCPTL